MRTVLVAPIRLSFVPAMSSTDTARPRLDIALSAPNVQLDDFKLGDWTAVESRPAEDKALTAEQIRDKAAKASDEAQRLLSVSVLRRQDAYLEVRVDQVRSGRDQLGSGRLEARLENGRADIGPVEVNIPGGSAKLSLAYEPTEQDVKAEMKKILSEIQTGKFAREWILENKANQPTFKAMRRRQRDHQLEEVGRQLRSMMSWIDAKEV